MRLLDVMNIIEAHRLLVHRRHTAQRRRRNRAAVVGVVATDNQFLVGLTQQVEVAMNQLNLSVVGLRPRIGKKDMLEALWRDLTKPCGQLRRRLVRASKEIVVERELGQLLCHRLLDALLAITKIAAPQAGHTVLNFITV